MYYVCMLQRWVWLIIYFKKQQQQSKQWDHSINVYALFALVDDRSVGFV